MTQKTCEEPMFVSLGKLNELQKQAVVNASIKAVRYFLDVVPEETDPEESNRLLMFTLMSFILSICKSMDDVKEFYLNGDQVPCIEFIADLCINSHCEWHKGSTNN